jgi:beta-phosphoglucomutase-like phosphatase (HAD superfamily)
VQLLPGVQRLIQHLVKHDVPIVVATASTRRNFDRKSENLKEFFDYFKGNIVCGSDVAGKTTGKPDPYIFLHAAGVLGKAVGTTEQCTEAEAVERSKGLVFEDAVYGVQAGKRAGMSGRVLFHSRELASCSLQLYGYLMNVFWTWLVLAHTSRMRRSRPSSISNRRNGVSRLMTLAFRGEPLQSG